MVDDGAPRVEYRLLGPVEVWADGHRIDAGQPRQRAVLAALLVDSGRVVPVETIIDRVWGQAAPDRVRATLRTHLSRIRRLLEQAAPSVSAPAALSHESGGYLLQVDSDQVDLHLFRRLAETAAHPGGSDISPESLRAALALWRGQPLAGIDGEWAGRMREIWARERLDVAVAWARAELARANPQPVLATLAELASDNPLVESLTEVVMRALHAAGRTSEALDLYAQIRTHLAEELGADPGSELQMLHQSLLRGEVEIARPTATARHVPRQLPAPPQMFTGRAAELADLEKIHDASTVVIAAIDGMAGVGKTALAVQAAHQMVDRYPDGQFFIDLHGHTEGVAPVEPGEALDRMLRSLGVPAQWIPAALDERAGLYRSRLADLRMTIVLDNAATEAQVAPLLPGAPGCLVLVTSRRRLSGLDHTYTLSLDTLPLSDAVTLLRQTAGEDRLAGQPPDLAAELVELCGRLPLAIRIAAARLRSHSAWDLAHLVRRLRDQRHRLIELEAGQQSITAALDLSYQDISLDLQRTYRLLGLHPGADIDAYAAAALLDSTPREAGRMLEQLLEAHLLQELIPGWYRFHDLTRVHAAHTAACDETEKVRRVALDRLLDYYRHTASSAMDAAYPYERERRPQVPPAGTAIPSLSPARALTWLDSELPNLLATVKYATEHDSPAYPLQLSTILHRHLRFHGPYHDAVSLHRWALMTARATGHQAAELDALVCIGHIHRLQGRYGQAIEDYQRALKLADITSLHSSRVESLVGLGTVHLRQGDHGLAIENYQEALQLADASGLHSSRVESLVGLGTVHLRQGWHGSAAEDYQQALQLADAIGLHSGRLEALVGLGSVHTRHGRYGPATQDYQQALQLARATGHRAGELDALVGLSIVDRMQGRYAQATEHFEQVLQLARAIGHHNVEQTALAMLGGIRLRQGRYGQACDHYQRLLRVARESGDRNFEFEALQGLGRLQHATGHQDAALTHHGQALALAGELGQPADEVRAYDGLARAYHALHQPEQARTHWRHALDILTDLGIDHTDDEETTTATIQAHLREEPRQTEGKV